MLQVDRRQHSVGYFTRLESLIPMMPLGIRRGMWKKVPEVIP